MQKCEVCLNLNGHSQLAEVSKQTQCVCVGASLCSLLLMLVLARGSSSTWRVGKFHLNALSLFHLPSTHKWEAERSTRSQG